MNTKNDIQGLTVYGTKDYDRFKPIQGNRGIFKPQVKRLLEDIILSNQLDTNPIIVNEKWEIINGQHRLTVARELGSYIWYLQKEGLDREDMKASNRTQKSWTTEDYVRSYADEGLADYQKILDTVKEVDNIISVPNVLYLFNRSVASRDSVSRKLVREGNYRITTYLQGMEIISVLEKFRPISLYFLSNNRSFLTAIYAFRFRYGGDFNKLISALKNNQVQLTHFSSPVSYLSVFQEAYPFMGKKTR
jgi:hypothetical protein